MFNNPQNALDFSAADVMTLRCLLRRIDEIIGIGKQTYDELLYIKCEIKSDKLCFCGSLDAIMYQSDKADKNPATRFNPSHSGVETSK